ncbi:MAG: single-stranded DNA-binding protein [Thermoplasmatales archaeon]|nr:MAG: single-stranded DNA-binding protein [Thermoplasmatales archaeon]
MANDLNRIILIGNLTRDPELKNTQSGSSVCNFSIANNRSYTQNGEKKEYTSFFNCVVWGKLGETINQYCKKGQRIGLEGKLQQRSWDDQNGNKRTTVEIVVENIQFLTPRKNDDSEQVQPETDIQSNYFSDEDIPF